MSTEAPAARSPQVCQLQPFEQRRHAQNQATAEPAPPATDQPTPPAAQREKVRVGEYEISPEELGAIMQRQAVEDQRRLTAPVSPEAYELKISPDAKLPGNVEFRFDGNDPGRIAAKNWAHARGLDQSPFSEMLTLYASHVAQQNAVLAERSRAEVAKAGVNAPARVDAVGKWIRGEVGDADAKPILATLVTDAHLRFFERMIGKLTSQGAASFTGQHRVAPNQGGIPGYENMSFEQRRYAQDQQAARRGR